MGSMGLVSSSQTGLFSSSSNVAAVRALDVRSSVFSVTISVSSGKSGNSVSLDLSMKEAY
ncbi:hypothetical protein DPMN_121474 [Dreissena polymorpha]|uniref:Uncharacterized protein n=1 Tax=Dreissena polymorpha TaxID=45954 RepID=A0A9D4GQL9_DREPO|nr:hypothetical protein DPMN_121474 [Dreissena polymorpha]